MVKQINYEHINGKNFGIIKTQCDKCIAGKTVGVGSLACHGCVFFISVNKVNRTVICGGQ